MAAGKNIAPYVILGIGIAATLSLVGYLVFKRKPVKCSSRFLFIGDSNTVIAHSYTKKIKQYCSGADIKEIATSGWSTNKMLTALQAELAGGNKYDVIAILGGSNDLCCPDSYPTKSNLETMYQLAKRSGARVVAITPPSKKYIKLGNPGWGGSNYQAQMDRLAGIVSWIKANKTADVIVDWHKITENKDAFVGTDYQHANAGAHEALLKELIKKIPIKVA